jgi:hypothetical protein
MQDSELTYVDQVGNIVVGEFLVLLDALSFWQFGTSKNASEAFEIAGIDQDLHWAAELAPNAGAAVVHLMTFGAVGRAIAGIPAAQSIGTALAANTPNLGAQLQIIGGGFGATFSLIAGLSHIDSGEYGKLGYDGVMGGASLQAIWSGWRQLFPKPNVTTTNPPAELPELRADYVDEVRALNSVRDSLKEAGKSQEYIARVLHSQRRAIGANYKAMTPLDELERIYARNLQKYGDKLGPTIEWLREHGKSWDDIIESAIRPGGSDLGY